jgi:heme-binding protein
VAGYRFGTSALVQKPAVMIAVLLVAAFAVAQLRPVPLTNPSPKGELSAPPEIDALLRRACYDCHSDHTRWPWYSLLAPFSWAVAHHVDRGRKEVNFSEWGAYYPATRKRKLEWMARAVREAVMPPWSYRLMHPDARLSDDDRVRLERWIEAELAGPASGPSAK